MEKLRERSNRSDGTVAQCDLSMVNSTMRPCSLGLQAAQDNGHTVGEVLKLAADQEIQNLPWFDIDALRTLCEDIPSDIEIWRLRLRFGLPTTIVAGKRFRVAVDLVDEIGQPPTTASFIKPKLQIQLNHAESVDAETPHIRFNVIEIHNRVNNRWTFDITVKEGAMNCRVMVSMTSSGKFGPNNRFHKAFQRFCSHSAWMNDDILVLPLDSDRIEVVDPSERHDTESSSKSAICRRIFCIPGTDLHVHKHGQGEQLLTVTEDYGDTMGAHIWDASIFLSFALLESVRRMTASLFVAMMELGAGCGLFGSVFRVLYRYQVASMLLTERAESIQLLKFNMETCNQQDIGSPVQVAPLTWGCLPLPDIVERNLKAGLSRVVFAADVLYFWEAHTALLATLEALASTDSGFQAIIAHKHRGVSTSKALEDVLTRSSNDQLPTKHEKSVWDGWRVDRLVQLGRVDLLRLTRRSGKSHVNE